MHIVAFSNLAILATSFLATKVAAGPVEGRLQHQHRHAHLRHRNAEVTATEVVNVELDLYPLPAGGYSTSTRTLNTTLIEPTAFAASTITSVQEAVAAAVTAPSAPSITKTTTTAPTSSSTPNLVGGAGQIAQAKDVARQTTTSSVVNAGASGVASSGGSGTITTAAQATGGQLKGIIYSQVSVVSSFAGIAQWAQDWDHSGLAACESILPGANYAPTLWDDSQLHLANWDSDAEAAIAAQDVTYLQGFNEPEGCIQGVQACITPGEKAADAYHTNFKKYYGNSKAVLVSPSFTSHQDGSYMGIPFLTDFYNNCTECQLDRLAVHYYAQCTTGDFDKEASDMMDWMQKASTAFGGKPIVVGEVGCYDHNDVSVNSQFLSAAASAFAKNTKLIDRWAYYAAATGMMIDGSTNALNAVGKALAAAS